MSTHSKIHNLVLQHCESIKGDIVDILRDSIIEFFKVHESVEEIRIIGNTPYLYGFDGKEIEYLSGKFYLKHPFVQTLTNLRYVDVIGDLIPLIIKKENYNNL